MNSNVTENIEALFGERFKVIREISRGGMGAVYLALDKANTKEIAIKRLLVSNNAAANPESFKKEFEIISKFDHENVLKVFEYFEDEDNDFYSMEYIPGESLKSLIEKWKGDQSPALTLNILLQFAKALKHIHEHGIIHHDVHPWNLLLSGIDGGSGIELKLKLIDFGISLNKTEQKEDQIKIGMSNYKSPEHYRGELLDYTADIYCFGAISYELLTGELPFDLNKYNVNAGPLRDFTELRLHTMKDVPSIKKLPKKIAYKINRMVQICMEKEPGNRYQVMQELIERIEDLQSELGAEGL